MLHNDTYSQEQFFFVQNKEGVTKELLLLFAVKTVTFSTTQQCKCFNPGTG